VGLFKSYFEKRKQKYDEKVKICSELISEVERIQSSVACLFSDAETYVEPGADLELRGMFEALRIPSDLKKVSDYKSLVSKRESLRSVFHELDGRIVAHNDDLTRKRIAEAMKIIGTIEGRSPDEQQWSCIVREFHNQLVVAGAGTGKTSVVVGKVKYLLKTGGCGPEDILVLSFTNASASEMRERIRSETGCDIRAITFHKLGKDIIAEAEGRSPSVTNIDLNEFAAEQIEVFLKSDIFARNLMKYLLFAHGQKEREKKFETEEEYRKYIVSDPYVTLKGEKIKSQGELDIANFLSISGIGYEYERPYEKDTVDGKHSQYCPDFFLTEHGIYIEHFGIDRNGNVPDYFSSEDGKTPSETYRDSMEWKRRLHKENGTMMIECYAYEGPEGTLLENLERKLTEHGVTMRPKSPQQILDSMDGEIKGGLPELVAKIITLIKCRGGTVEDSLSGTKLTWGDRMLLSIVRPIFDAYEQTLAERGEIDFNDMINKAALEVQQGRYANPYTYVIVDEYQDISASRFNLLRRLREDRDYRLFCVGDDWQSIYGFNGSDIGFTFDFTKYWGPTDVCRIERTYRFPRGTAEISGEFIMRNPKQMRKDILSDIEGDEVPMEVVIEKTERDAMGTMYHMLDSFPDGSTVFMIGRYTFDIDRLRNTERFTSFYDKTTGTVRMVYKGREDLKINFITAHKSKGLQADYVFIINNLDDHKGFPCKIADEGIVGSLTGGGESFPFAEERRLYYVAMTRAKRKTVILAEESRTSEFVNELEHRYGDRLSDKTKICPMCGGRLVKRSGQYGEFYGCSNFPSKGCRFKKKI
jgi:DNA helicase-4